MSDFDFFESGDLLLVSELSSPWMLPKAQKQNTELDSKSWEASCCLFVNFIWWYGVFALVCVIIPYFFVKSAHIHQSLS